MTSTSIDVDPRLKRTGRRAGYAIAIAVNVVMLIVVNNILAWGWLRFLTEDFSLVVPWISFSLVASIIANVVYEIDDRPTIKSIGQILLNVISVIVTYQIWLVFPFDFSSYDFNWSAVTRVLLILAMVGAGVGAIVQFVKLIGARPERR